MLKTEQAGERRKKIRCFWCCAIVWLQNFALFHVKHEVKGFSFLFSCGIIPVNPLQTAGICFLPKVSAGSNAGGTVFGLGRSERLVLPVTEREERIV